MSFFLLLPKDKPPLRLPNFLSEAARQGFSSTASIDLGAFQLILLSDLSATPSAFLKLDDGDFIAATGSLIYDGLPSPDCLPKLLTNFQPGAFDWKNLIGTHSVLVHKEGSLHLFTDGLGAAKLYTNPEGTLWSNSFLALCELTRPRFFDPQACYEYVIAGSVYGTRTLAQGIRTLPANSLLTIARNGTAEVRQLSSPIGNTAADGPRTMDAIAAQLCGQLDTVFGPIAANFGDRIRLSFSGGFDSRLMLAMLLRHGAQPSLFVYGDEEDEDVHIARIICRGEDLPLKVIDKSAFPALPLDAFAEETEKNLYAFDGWKVETGLFDHGADRQDRLGRHVAGQVPLNGSLGEIYRNFFYIPDRPSSTGAVISTFYSRYDPKAFTARFNETDYRAAMAGAMREAIGAQGDSLSRSQVEEVYPKFRGRFWTGRDAGNNQRFGPMFFPYLEHAAISNTAKIPIGFKDLGRLQGCMIAQVNPRLADYPSDYGFPLNGARPWQYRLKTFLGTQRPPVLRKYSFRLTHRSREARDGAISADYLSRVIDLDFPIMRALFNLEAVHCATQYGLIATLEYLGERYNLEIPKD